MDQKVAELEARSNGKASLVQLLNDSKARQSHEATPSSFRNAQRGLHELDNSSHTAIYSKSRCNSLTGSIPHSTQSLPFSETTRGIGDLGTAKSASQAGHKISSDTSDQDAKDGSDQEIEEFLSSVSHSTPTVSSRPSEPVPQPAEVADPHHVDDDPVYNIGETKIYDQTQKAIPKLYEARWQVIRPHIFDRVHNRLRRGRFAMRLNKRRDPAIIDLMSAGVTKARSMPAVMVVIPRHIKTMQDFLDTDTTVQNRCKPEDGTTVELLALACRGSSTLVGMPSDPPRNDLESQSDSNSDFLYASDEYFSEESIESDDSQGPPTLTTSWAWNFDLESVSVIHDPKYVAGDLNHGMGIRLIIKDDSRYVRGTCGGLLQLLDTKQPPRLVGLIAGHLLEQLGQDYQETSHKTPEDPQAACDIVFPQSLGRLPLHDWALFDATRLGFELGTASQNNVIVIQEPDFPVENTEVVIRTSRGEVTGTLASSSSGIMLNEDQGFVHVRTIVVNRGSLLTKGDSGSWVFQKEVEKVYGYIIATSGNNHAYMVPMHAAIAEIQSTLGAVAISLAISTDPRPQVHPGTTEDYIGRTDRSIFYSDIGESVQMSSVLGSIFSSPPESVHVRSILSGWPTTQESSPSRNPHPYSRPYRTTTTSPASSVASLQEEHTQVEQIQGETQNRLAKDAPAASPQDQPQQVDLNQPKRDQNQELETRETPPKNISLTLSQEHHPGVERSPKTRGHSKSQAEQKQTRQRKSLDTETPVTLSQEHLPEVDQSKTPRDYGKSQTERRQAGSQESLNTETSLTFSHQQAPLMSHSQLLSEHSRARTFLMYGSSAKAIPILKRAVETHERTLGQDHATCLASQHELAVAYIQNGETSEAIRILEHVVEVEATTLNYWAIDRLTSQHELARAYLAGGQVSEAVRELDSVVKVKLSTLGKSDPHLLASQIVLAEAYLSANRATDAISTLEDVLAFSTAPSREHERIRSSSQQWLNLAHMQRRGLNLEGLSGQTSRPNSVFIQPRK